MSRHACRRAGKGAAPPRRRSFPSISAITSTSGSSSSRSAARFIRCRWNCSEKAASLPTSSASNSPASCLARRAKRRRPRSREAHSITAPTSSISSRIQMLDRLSRTSHIRRRMTQLVNTHKPEILLLGATTLGRDLAGSVATTLLTGLTADCTELAVDADGSLAATRPTFGGSLLCTIYTLNYRPQMATVRPRVMPMPARDENRAGAHRALRGRPRRRDRSSPRF